MIRSQRIRIVLGLGLVLLGAATSIIGPILLRALSAPQLNADNIPATMSALDEQGKWLNACILAGLAIAMAGFLIAFFEWARWFVSRTATSLPK